MGSVRTRVQQVSRLLFKESEHRRNKVCLPTGSMVKRTPVQISTQTVSMAKPLGLTKKEESKWRYKAVKGVCVKNKDFVTTRRKAHAPLLPAQSAKQRPSYVDWLEVKAQR